MPHYIWEKPHWSEFTWDNEKIIGLIGMARLKQGKLLAKIDALHGLSVKEAEAEILIEETIKTAQLEGERYGTDSVRSSVVRHLGLSTAGLPVPQRHIDGLVEVLVDATHRYEEALTTQRLKTWQAALFPTGFSGLRKVTVGTWRKTDPMEVVSGPIGKEKVHYVAPPAKNIPQEIKKFLQWWEESVGEIEGLIRAGIAHFWFVSIHPFEDGNGRIARAITDMALAQDEERAIRSYSLSHQIMAERQHYYHALEQSQEASRDITAWLQWFLGCFSRSIDASEQLIEHILQKANFWSRHATKEVNERQKKVLNKLLNIGKGQFQGGLTTRKFSAMTGVSRATAYREIHNLVNKKMLRRMRGAQGGGRSVSYELCW